MDFTFTHVFIDQNCVNESGNLISYIVTQRLSSMIMLFSLMRCIFGQ